MERVVSPPQDELDKLRQPLTLGERAVFDFFHHYLPIEWEIYLQPHLNGLRPDIVLLNPNVGIAVFEVKDWNLDAVHYSMTPKDGAPPLLKGYKGGKAFSRQRDNPVEQIKRYKEEIFDLYCPRLKEKAGFAAITAGIIFPFADDQRVLSLLMPALTYYAMCPQYNPVSGMHALATGNLAAVFPEAMRRSSYVMRPELAQDMRNWLVEPSFAADQREPLILDSNQKAIALSRTVTGYRRIKGPAGSGKSLVLAARAAQLLAEGKQVLVVTYNITLLHYLMDMAVRWPESVGKTRSDITWLNFHAWCRRVCAEAKCQEEYRALLADYTDGHPRFPEQPSLDIVLPALVSDIIDRDDKREDPLVTRFDAVLIDEGQDFLPEWWSALRKVHVSGGEMLLAADATQDVYGRSHAWTDDAMKGAGFVGVWATLKQSYRLPPQALEYARDFASRFLPRDLVDLPEPLQGELGFSTCGLRWVCCSSGNAAEVCVAETLRMAEVMKDAPNAIADITFLCPQKKFGERMVKALSARRIQCVHTFHEDPRESRRQKMGFYMGDARIKATTLHSFKGWESKCLVVYIGDAATSRALALVYAGLTRIKRSDQGSHLTIISSSPTLREYGEEWPEFVDIEV